MNNILKALEGKGLNLVQNLVLKSTEPLLNGQAQQLISIPVQNEASLNRLFNAYQVAEEIRVSHQEGSLDIVNAPGGLIQDVFSNFLRQGKLIPQPKNQQAQRSPQEANLNEVFGVFEEYKKIGEDFESLSRKLAQAVQGHLVQHKHGQQETYKNGLKAQQHGQQNIHQPIEENEPHGFLKLLEPILRRKIGEVNQSLFKADDQNNPVPVPKADQQPRVDESEDVEFVQKYMQPLYNPDRFAKKMLETKAKDYIRDKLPQNKIGKVAFQMFYDPLVDTVTNSQTFIQSLKWLKENVCDLILSLPSTMVQKFKELQVEQKIRTMVDQALNWFNTSLKKQQGPVRDALQACEKQLQTDIAKMVFQIIPIEPQVRLGLALVGAFTRIDFDAKFDQEALSRHVKEAYHCGKKLLGNNVWAKRLNRLESVAEKVQHGVKIVEMVNYKLRSDSNDQTVDPAGRVVNDLMREARMMTQEEVRQVEVREVQQLVSKYQEFPLEKYLIPIQRPLRKQQSNPKSQNPGQTGNNHQLEDKHQSKKFWENKIEAGKPQIPYSKHTLSFQGESHTVDNKVIPIPRGKLFAGHLVKGNTNANEADTSSGKYYTQERVKQARDSANRTTTRFVQGKDQLSRGSVLGPQQAFQKGNVLFKKVITNQQPKTNVESPDQDRRILAPDSYFNDQANMKPESTKQKSGGRINKASHKPDVKGAYSINTVDFHHSLTVNPTTSLQLAIPSELSYLSQNNDLGLLFCQKLVDGSLLGYERVEQSLQKEESENKKRVGMSHLSHEELRYKILGQREQVEEFVVGGTYQILSQNTFEIDSQKQYDLSGEVRSNHPMSLAIGLACFDKSHQIIPSYRFSTKGSPVVYKSQNHKQREIEVEGDLSQWNSYPQNPKLGDRFLGFYFDGNTNQSPDNVITCDNDPTTQNQTEAAFEWVDVKKGIIRMSEFGYQQVSGKMEPGVTRIANHVYSEQNPTLICTILESLEPSEAFQEVKVHLQGQGLIRPQRWVKDTIKCAFWPGTKFVKVVIYSNRMGYHKRLHKGELVWRNFNLKQSPQ